MNLNSSVLAYLNFLKRRSVGEPSLGIEDFDANQKALFEIAMLNWFQGTPFTVRETIGQSELGSPATLHKRLQRLIAQNMLSSVCMGADRRTKFVMPTAKGLEYLHWLGKQLPISGSLPKEPSLTE